MRWRDLPSFWSSIFRELPFGDERNRCRLVYYGSPEWAAVRQIVLAVCGGWCNRCEAQADAIHHRSYDSLGDEVWTDIEPLCNACHAAHHEKAR